MLLQNRWPLAFQRDGDSKKRQFGLQRPLWREGLFPKPPDTQLSHLKEGNKPRSCLVYQLKGRIKWDDTHELVCPCVIISEILDVASGE